MALLSFVDSTPRAYRLKVSNAYLPNSTTTGTSPSAGSTVLAPTCTANGNAITVGDNSATSTYSGFILEDLAINLPTSCTMNGIEIKTAYSNEGNYIERVEVHGQSQTVGVGILVDADVWEWTFNDNVILYIGTGYQFGGADNLDVIHQGQVFNTGTAISALAGEYQIVIDSVDIEVWQSMAIDANWAGGMEIRNCYIENDQGAATRAIRLASGGIVSGVVIDGNYIHTSAPLSAYAIEIDAAGFSGVNIINNTFDSFGTNILNNAGSNGSGGTYAGNVTLSTSGATTADMTSAAGFTAVQWTRGPAAGSITSFLSRPGVRGTAITAANLAQASFGSTATLGAMPGSRDTAGSVYVIPGGSGIYTGASMTLTFADGSWGPYPPFCVVSTNAGINGVARISSVTPTTLAVYFEGTPTSGAQAGFTYHCSSSN